MKGTVLMLSAAIVGAAAVLTSMACGDDDDGAAAPTATSAPAVVRPLEQVLTEAINEEYKARATYQAVIEKHGAIAPFTNIVNAESTHVEAWKNLLQKNSFAVPADPYAGKVTAPETVKAACQAGVAAEKEDVALYDRLMKDTTDAEALKVMAEQRKVSQENHLPAFEKCA